jgi:uncharacterized protein (TIGR02466 family)
MSFKVNILSTPIFTAVSDNAVVRSIAEKLVYEFKETTDSAGIMSHYWDLGAESGQKGEYEKFGMTTFYSGNLASKPEWLEVAEFIENTARSLLSSEYQGNLRITNMWATLYPAGAFVPEHIHNNSLYSGVFYVKAKANCGDLIFKDPVNVAKSMCSKLGRGFPTTDIVYTQQVEDGLMVLFPSWLPHSSQPNQSSNDRIIISFNLDFPNS